MKPTTLIIEIEGRRAIPARAIPFVTRGFLNAAEILHILSDPDAYGGVDGLGPVSARQLLADSTHVLVAPNEFDRFYSKVESLGNREPRNLETIQCIPPGLFLWEVPIKNLYVFLLSHHQMFMPIHARERPGDYEWSETPLLTDEEMGVVQAGFASDESVLEDRDPTDDRGRVEAAFVKLENLFLAEGLVLSRAPLPIAYKRLEGLVHLVDPTLSSLTLTQLKSLLRSVGINGRAGVKSTAQFSPAVTRIESALRVQQESPNSPAANTPPL